MSINLHPLYPMPAAGITSQVTTVTTGVTTVTAYNLASPNAVQLVTFDVQVSDVRVYWDGSTPSSSAGHLLYAGTAYTWDAGQYNASKFILDASATASAVIVASPFVAA